MRSWLSRLAVIAVSLLAIVAVVATITYRLYHGTPQWYRRSSATLAERDETARNAFNKFAGIVNAASAIRNAPQPSAPQSIDVSFTDDELNAFFEKWSNFENWKQNYEQYVEDPIIILRDGQLILAGRVKDIDTIVSIEFDPSLESNGQLNLRMTRILGGRLQLPEAMVRPYFHRIIDTLRAKLPMWRATSQILRDGGANESLICASLSRLLIHTLQHESTDAVLFLPVLENQANVPVRIVSVNVTDHTLTMLVTPLNAGERTALLQRIQANDPQSDSSSDRPANPPTNLAMSR